MPSSIEQIVVEIKKNLECSSCGGTVNDGICIYCGNVYEEFPSLISKLTNLFDDKYDTKEMSDDMNMIYSLKDKGIKKVDDFLIKTDYESIVKKKYEEICNKIKNDIELSSDDCKNYEFLFENYEEKKNIVYCCNYVIKSILLDKSSFSYDFFEKVIILLAEKIAEEWGFKSECRIGKLKDEWNGCQVYNHIRLNVDLLKRMYYQKDPKLLGTIFHELTHVSQYYRQNRKKIVSLNDLIQIKEHSISGEIKGYYDDNYWNITLENEARLNGDILLIRYLESLFNIHVEDKKEETERIKMTMMQNEDMLRSYNGSSIDMNDLFDEVIADKPKYLEDYPSLKYQYKVGDDGIVISKNVDELIDDFLKIDFDMLDKHSLDAIKEIYKYLINKAKLKDKNKSY